MTFDFTSIFLVILACLALAFIIYDGIVLSLWKGPTLLKVRLRPRNKADGYMFVGLMALLLVMNLVRSGTIMISILLAILMVLFFYISFVRNSKVIFKENGLFYALIFFPYAKIERINISEDGILVIETNRQRLMISPKEKADIEKMIAVIKKYK